MTARNGFAPERQVLGFSSRDPFSPVFKTGRVKMISHQSYNLFFAQSKLFFYGIYWGAVFPCHFNYSMHIIFG